MLNELKLTVIYDNYPYMTGLKHDWGFSCLIEGGEKTVLFDTGGNADIFMQNLKDLNILPSSIDIVIISHDHWDHIGGLENFLKNNHDVKVYILNCFSDATKNMVKKTGAQPVITDDPQNICTGIFTTGRVSGPVNEEAVFIKTSKGIVVITGCAHPGADNIVNKVRELTEEDFIYVLGGFHLLDDITGRTEEVIKNFRDLGIKYVSATHCTGDIAVRKFMEEYKDNFIKTGPGKVITLDEFN